MAVLNFGGAELGTTLDTIAIAGGGSLPTSGGGVPRTGTYAYRCNTAGSAKWSSFGAINSNGRPANMARTAATYYTLYLKFTSLPSTNVDVLSVRNSAGSAVVAVNVNSSGQVTLVGTSTSGTVATLSTGTWYILTLRVTSNGTSGLAVDGGTELTVTANNVTQDRLALGTFGSATMDAYFEDWVIDDASFWGSPAVKISVPTGAGTAGSGWDTGTSNLYSAVDEIPHNTTDYIASTGAGDTNKVRRFTMQSATTIGGLSNTIINVQAVGIMRESSSTSTLGTVGLRSSSSEVTGTMADIGDTNYVGIFLNNALDPNGSIAWTTSGFNAIEIGAHKGSDESGIRCTALYAMVLTAIPLAEAYDGAGAVEAEGDVAGTGTKKGQGSGATGAVGTAAGTGTGDHTGTGAAEAVGTVAGSGAKKAAGTSAGDAEAIATVAATGIAHRAGSAAIEVIGTVEGYSQIGGPGAVEAIATVSASGIAHKGGAGAVEADGVVAGSGGGHRAGAGAVQVAWAISGAGLAHRQGAGAAAVVVVVAGAGQSSRAGAGAIEAIVVITSAGRIPQLPPTQRFEIVWVVPRFELQMLPLIEITQSAPAFDIEWGVWRFDVVSGPVRLGER